MPVSLDDIDLQLLTELQDDADRSNVELARAVGLSPAATHKRVRRLKDSGVIRAVTADVDAAAAGFPLHVYVAVTVGRHDEAAHRRLETAAREIPQVVGAVWVTGETDALMEIVARSIEDLQRVLLLLSSRGGALRVTTLLRLEVIKERAPLPHADGGPAGRTGAGVRGRRAG